MSKFKRKILVCAYFVIGINNSWSEGFSNVKVEKTYPKLAAKTLRYSLIPHRFFVFKKWCRHGYNENSHSSILIRKNYFIHWNFRITSNDPLSKLDHWIFIKTRSITIWNHVYAHFHLDFCFAYIENCRRIRCHKNAINKGRKNGLIEIFGWYQFTFTQTYRYYYKCVYLVRDTHVCHTLQSLVLRIINVLHCKSQLNQ